MSSAAGQPSDRTGFLGARIPSEVEVMAEHLKDFDKEVFRTILKAVVSALEGKDCRESVAAIAEHGNLSEEQLSYIIAGMYTLLKEALRLPASSLKQEVFKEDLRDIRVSEEFIADFASLIFGSRRAVLKSAAAQEGIRWPGIAGFRWRVDVAISTSSLARTLQPFILMQLTDGNAHRFEVPVSKFQELRYNVALILKEMNNLEKRSVLKIQD
ncbi:LOW QUALITY PROTEIN: COMM domain-containing protein 5-like [Polyodon spathula]|uniref:LOW QUALITY PROTEIN: COMM domain-containing protein 5-like n=1 Tax=Polyodon spathula TaxID=7913 RepID=UPI001B7E5A0B|nr:LOW QUALITY PROTEIN: COMM domain-containing protein 5-like [Polyodon spathula]